MNFPKERQTQTFISTKPLIAPSLCGIKFYYPLTRRGKGLCMFRIFFGKGRVFLVVYFLCTEIIFPFRKSVC